MSWWRSRKAKDGQWMTPCGARGCAPTSSSTTKQTGAVALGRQSAVPKTVDLLADRRLAEQPEHLVEAPLPARQPDTYTATVVFDDLRLYGHATASVGSRRCWRSD